jgi:DUF971 family protein
MNEAFVKVRKGNFPDKNYYIAWKGLVENGYNVIKFEEDDEGTIDAREDTPVFAGVGSCRKIIKRIWGWDYLGINPYPLELMPYMHRKVERKKWVDAREEALEGHKFIKPVIQKQFNGAVLNTILDTIRTGKMEADHEVFICDPVEFLSEYRIYVHEHEVVGVKHYHGDPYLPLRKELVDEMIRAYRPSAPIAYSLDLGVLNDAQKNIALVEINDGICLGNYGLDSIFYAEMMDARWMELTTQGHV